MAEFGDPGAVIAQGGKAVVLSAFSVLRAQAAQGFEMAAANALGVSAASEGRIRYNSATQTFQASLNGAAYVDIATGATGVTLDGAYDFGGAGAGRTITVDSGAVTLTAGGTTAGCLQLDGSRTIASAASATWRELYVTSDVSLSGSTNVTTATGFNLIEVDPPTITGTVTVTSASTLYIGGAPVGSGVTLTSSYAIWVDANDSRFDGRVRFGTAGSVIAPNLCTDDDTDRGLFINGGALGGGVGITQQSVEMFTCYNAGGLQQIRFFTPGSPSGGAANTHFEFTSSNDGPSNSNTELIDVNFILTHTVTYGSTAPVTQRAFLVQSPTYASSSVGTITDAATVAITAAPTAGTNVTITNSYALWVQAGVSRFDGQIRTQDGTAAAPAIRAVTNTNTGIFFTTNVTGFTVSGSEIGRFEALNFEINQAANSSNFQITANNGTAIFTSNTANASLTLNSTGATAAATVTVQQSVATSGTPGPVLTVTSAAHTGLTASSEVIAVDFNLSATQQHATGALATQRAIRIQAPTYSFVAASTITDAVTVAIMGAPIAGTNATITNAFALDVTGAVRITGKLTVTGAIDPTDITLSAGGTAHFMQYAGGSTAAVSAASTGRMRYDEVGNIFQASLNGGAYANIPTVASANTWSANQTFSANVVIGVPTVATSAKLHIAGVTGQFVLDETDAAVDAKMWDFILVSGELRGRCLDDANSVGNTWLSVTRSGASPGTIVFSPSGLTEIKSGATAQELRVFGDTTGPRYISLMDVGAEPTLNAQGAAGNLARDGTKYLFWTTSEFSPAGDDTFDLGRTTATYRIGYFGTALVVGTNPATTGIGRFANGGTFYWRNAANSADIATLAVDSANAIVLAGESGSAVKIATATGGVGLFGVTPVVRTALAAATGTATRTTFATSTVTVSELAERVKAMIDDWRATGYWS